MKTKYYYSSAIVLALSLAACSENGMIAPEVPTSGQEIRISASLGADTRVSVKDEDSQLKFTWADGDHITVINGMQATDFVLSDGAGTGRAEFAGRPAVAIRGGEKIYGVINPAANADNHYCLDDNGNVTISLGDQTGKLTDKYQYMFAESTYEAGEDVPVAFKFNHLVSILKFNVTLPDGVSSLDSLQFINGNRLVTDATLIVNTPMSSNYDTFYAGELVHDWADARYNRGSVTIKDVDIQNNVATVYIYVLPAWSYGREVYGDGNSSSWQESPWVTPMLMAYAGGKVLISSEDFRDRHVYGGKMYEIGTQLADIPQLKVGLNSDLIQDQYYAFTPKEDGKIYLRDCFYSCMDMPDRNILTAGKTYLFKFYSESCTVVYKPIKTITLGEEISDGSYMYKFTPSESGYYMGKCVNSNLWFEDINTFNGCAFLEGGKSYFISSEMYGEDSKASIIKLDERIITTGDTITINDDVVLHFTPEVTGNYMVSSDLVDTYWDIEENSWSRFQMLEAGNTYSMFCKKYDWEEEDGKVSIKTVNLVDVEVGKQYPLTANTVYQFVTFAAGTPIENVWYRVAASNCDFSLRETTNIGTEWNVYKENCAYYNFGEEWAIGRVFTEDAIARIYVNEVWEEGQYFSVTKYANEKTDAQLDQEYTVDPGHIVTYTFTAPEDGEYEIKCADKWLYWRFGGNVRYLNAGESQIFYVDVPYESEESTTFTVEKYVEE